MMMKMTIKVNLDLLCFFKERGGMGRKREREREREREGGRERERV